MLWIFEHYLSSEHRGFPAYGNLVAGFQRPGEIFLPEPDHLEVARFIAKYSFGVASSRSFGDYSSLPDCGNNRAFLSGRKVRDFHGTGEIFVAPGK